MEGAADLDRLTFISGGQTGIDRAVLDFCLEQGIRCGGWCPQGRRAEDGPIPDRYPLEELPGASFDDRTRRNVVESDATVIIFHGTLEGGTLKSLEYAKVGNKPCLMLDCATLAPHEAASLLFYFLRGFPEGRINFSGPRESEWEGGYAMCRSILNLALDSLHFTPKDY